MVPSIDRSIDRLTRRHTDITLASLSRSAFGAQWCGAGLCVSKCIHSFIQSLEEGSNVRTSRNAAPSFCEIMQHGMSTCREDDASRKERGS